MCPPACHLLLDDAACALPVYSVALSIAAVSAVVLPTLLASCASPPTFRALAALCLPPLRSALAELLRPFLRALIDQRLARVAAATAAVSGTVDDDDDTAASSMLLLPSTVQRPRPTHFTAPPPRLILRLVYHLHAGYRTEGWRERGEEGEWSSARVASRHHTAGSYVLASCATLRGKRQSSGVSLTLRGGGGEGEGERGVQTWQSNKHFRGVDMCERPHRSLASSPLISPSLRFLPPSPPSAPPQIEVGSVEEATLFLLLLLRKSFVSFASHAPTTVSASVTPITTALAASWLALLANARAAFLPYAPIVVAATVLSLGWLDTQRSAHTTSCLSAWIATASSGIAPDSQAASPSPCRRWASREVAQLRQCATVPVLPALPRARGWRARLRAAVGGGGGGDIDGVEAAGVAGATGRDATIDVRLGCVWVERLLGEDSGGAAEAAERAQALCEEVLHNLLELRKPRPCQSQCSRTFGSLACLLACATLTTCYHCRFALLLSEFDFGLLMSLCRSVGLSAGGSRMSGIRGSSTRWPASCFSGHWCRSERCPPNSIRYVRDRKGGGEGKGREGG